LPSSPTSYPKDNKDQTGFLWRDRNVERGKGLFADHGFLLGVAILSLILLIVALIPFAGPIVIMAPLPVLYYCYRFGRVQGMAVLVVSFLVVSGILGLLGRPPNFALLLMIGLTGVMLSEVLKRGYSFDKTFLIASLALFFFGIGLMIFHALRVGVSPWEMIDRYVMEIANDNLLLYEKLGIPADQLLLIRENLPQITQFFAGIFPALALSGAIITVWLNLIAGRLLLQRSAVGFPDFGDLSLWKAPERLVWILIAAGGMVLAPGILNIVGMNLLIVCGLIYFCQGMAIAGYFFRRRKVPVILRFLFYLLILVQQYMVLVVIAFGLFDIWIDFRKRITEIKDVQA